MAKHYKKCIFVNSSSYKRKTNDYIMMFKEIHSIIKEIRTVAIIVGIIILEILCVINGIPDNLFTN